MKKIILYLLFVIILEANELKKITIQFMWLDQFEFAGYYIAKEKGFYKNNNLDVNFRKFDFSMNIANEVTNKNADFGISSSSLMIERAKGKDIVLLGTIFQSSPLVLLALKNSDISNINDMVGKRVMMAAEQKNFAPLQTMLTVNKIDLNEINIIKKTPSVQDLIDKKTDLISAYTTNEPIVLKEMGYESNIFHPKDYGFDFYDDILFTTNEYIKNNPETVDRFYKASIQGWNYAFEHIEETAKIIFDKYNTQNKSLKSLIEEGYEMRKYVYDSNGKIGTLSIDRLRLILYAYKLIGLIKKDVDLEKLIYKKSFADDLKLTNSELDYLSSKKIINICVNPNMNPIESFKTTGYEGISIDILNVIKAKIHTPFKIKSIFDKENCDVFTSISREKAIKNDLNLTSSYLESSLALVTKINKPYYENANIILKNENIAVVKNSVVDLYLNRVYPNYKFIKVDNLEEGMKKVVSGNVFGFIDNIYSVAYLIQNNYIGELKVSSVLNKSLSYGLGIAKKEPILYDIFEKSINNISPSKSKEIINKWSQLKIEENTERFKVNVIISIFFIILIFIIIYQFKEKQKEKLFYLTAELKKLNFELEKKNKSLDKMLITRSKQATFGIMIDTISHQWKQPLNELGLQFLKLNTELSFKKVSPSKKFLEDFLRKNESIIDFMSQTIEVFRNFYRSSEKRTLVNISDVINDLILFFDLTFELDMIKVKKDIQPNIKHNCSTQEFAHSILNILVNSKDAISKNSIENPVIEIILKEDNGKIVLTIEDNAGGIKVDPIDKIFDSGESTKVFGGGLGLYITKKIVEERMNGKISVENTNCGAKFQIVLKG